MLFEDFAHYFTSRKPRSQFALLIVDEFSSLAEGAGMAARIEQARGFNTSLSSRRRSSPGWATSRRPRASSAASRP